MKIRVSEDTGHTRRDAHFDRSSRTGRRRASKPAARSSAPYRMVAAIGLAAALLPAGGCAPTATSRFRPHAISTFLLPFGPRHPRPGEFSATRNRTRLAGPRHRGYRDGAIHGPPVRARSLRRSCWRMKRFWSTATPNAHPKSRRSATSTAGTPRRGSPCQWRRTFRRRSPCPRSGSSRRRPLARPPWTDRAGLLPNAGHRAPRGGQRLSATAIPAPPCGELETVIALDPA